MSEFHHSHSHRHGRRGIHDHRHGHRGTPPSRWPAPPPAEHWFAGHPHVHPTRPTRLRCWSASPRTVTPWPPSNGPSTSRQRDARAGAGRLAARLHQRPDHRPALPNRGPAPNQWPPAALVRSLAVLARNRRGAGPGQIADATRWRRLCDDQPRRPVRGHRGAGAAGFSGVRPITWDKTYPGLGGGLRHRTEFVLVGYLPGSRTLTGVDLVSVPAVGPGTAGRYATEKPADLGRALAAIADIGRGDFVVDPFCGSGALLIGAAERGARVAGYDVAAAAIKRASARLAVAGKPARPRRLREATRGQAGRRARPSAASRPVRARPARPRQTKRGTR